MTTAAAGAHPGGRAHHDNRKECYPLMKMAYIARRFSKASQAIIDNANAIIEEYDIQGFVLSLRQIFYQFVTRELIANTMREYKRLGSIINDARLAGLIDWQAIIDRERNLQALAHWRDPLDLMRTAARQYLEERWADQPHRVEVWIEKDALAGVFEPICEELDVPFFSCRGYTSQSEMWAAAQRLREYTDGLGQEVTILHFGDHDPSGIDMTRDIRDRLRLFGVSDLNVWRIALNMDQVREYRLPPNPAKLTDTRVSSYVRNYGRESWELDALDPRVLPALVRENVNALRDAEAWEAATAAQETGRSVLTAIGERFDEVREFVS